jgi:1-pyrroline-5-carboxylate dehydrogenase
VVKTSFSRMNHAVAAEVATALARGAFEFQGQKCSAASRAYIPNTIWAEVKRILVEQVNSFKVGTPRDTSNFVNAVIDEKAFDSIAAYIDFAKSQADAEIIIAGGTYDKSRRILHPANCYRYV